MTTTRRSFFRGLAAAGAATALASSLGAPRARAATPARRLLFVIGASGGASIIDSFLPLVASEAAPASRDTIVAHPDAVVQQTPGSAFRVVRNPANAGFPTSTLFRSSFEHGDLVRAHGADMLLATVENTSVNHVVAQGRALNGAGIDRGRTLLEAAAMTHGEGLVLPAVNLASGGYLDAGTHPDTPDWARAETVNDPLRFAASTDGSRGLFPVGDPRMPRSALLTRARGARERLEDLSPLASRTSPMRARYLELRRTPQPRMEAATLIESLMLVSSGIDLARYGLAPAPAIAEMGLLDRFPQLLEDRYQAQTALAYLLAREGLSAAVCWVPGFAPSFLSDGTITDTPIAFDFSHNDHVTTQNVMWSRVAGMVDALVRLLKETPTDDGTLWDRSLVYVDGLRPRAHSPRWLDGGLRHGSPPLERQPLRLAAPARQPRARRRRGRHGDHRRVGSRDWRANTRTQRDPRGPPLQHRGLGAGHRVRGPHRRERRHPLSEHSRLRRAGPITAPARRRGTGRRCSSTSAR
jgi:hypothetical protein